MKNHRLLYPLITFFLTHSIFIQGQVNADFTMSQQSGCSPLIVNFTSQSTGDSLHYMWYLGPQQGTSELENPQATYTNQGIYDISLVVWNGTSRDSTSKQLVVFTKPTANFSVDNQGCAPHLAQFNDLSTQGSGQIVAWEWDFGTGEIIHEKNPSKTFSTPGKYNVFLKVTDVNSCFASINRPQYIDVIAKPVSNFTFSPASSCEIPAQITFSNSSNGEGALTYAWTFGDGTTSTQKNPVKTYNNFGTYDVNLKTTTSYGCDSSISKKIYVSEVSASGKLSQQGKTIVTNDTVCAGVVDFESTTTGTDRVTWNFGDGTSATSIKGFHNYTVTGWRTITLIASYNTECADTIEWRVYFERPLANFSLSPAYSCKTPVLVNFTNQSTDDVKWTWTFPNGAKVYTE
ncbi:MAG: PKD domain-containing protein, partial [Bacteroidales bacterium]|nr:PKD domain-containing protein [Bacteroidales bacterium]